MLMPEQVLVYGDCAVNPDPDAEQLADIAIQSADSAAAFGIPPRVAMISYSTGSSGSGSDVEKVREATRIAKEKRPDLMIDGPMQYDAASVESVGRQKAPDSAVAGRATVFVFPTSTPATPPTRRCSARPMWYRWARCCKACASRSTTCRAARWWTTSSTPSP